MYYMRLCSEKLLSDIRARTLFVLLPRSRAVLLRRAVTYPPAPLPARVLPLQGTLHRSHFAPGSCFSSRWQLFAALRANSEAISVSPSSPFRRLYLVRLFIRSMPFPWEKRMNDDGASRSSVQLDDRRLLDPEKPRELFTPFARSIPSSLSLSLHFGYNTRAKFVKPRQSYTLSQIDREFINKIYTTERIIN